MRAAFKGRFGAIFSRIFTYLRSAASKSTAYTHSCFCKLLTLSQQTSTIKDDIPIRTRPCTLVEVLGYFLVKIINCVGYLLNRFYLLVFQAQKENTTGVSLNLECKHYKRFVGRPHLLTLLTAVRSRWKTFQLGLTMYRTLTWWAYLLNIYIFIHLSISPLFLELAEFGRESDRVDGDAKSQNVRCFAHTCRGVAILPTMRKLNLYKFYHLIPNLRL